MDYEMIHTNAGLSLLAKLEQGIPLDITRVCGGAGRSTDLSNLTALANPKQEFEITGKSQNGPQATIYVRLTNQGLQAGYDLTQIAVFAKDPTDGEILYRVAQFERAIPIPAEKDFPDYSIESQIIDIISNASKVEATINQTGMITQAQLYGALRDFFTISDTPPNNPFDGLRWLKPIGSLSLTGEIGGTGSNIQLLNVSGTHMGDMPPEDKKMLWVKPVTQ